jgi:hypothetical protein
MARLINATNVVVILAQSVADAGDRGRVGDVASINLSRVGVSLAQMVKLGFVSGTSGSSGALTRKVWYFARAMLSVGVTLPVNDMEGNPPTAYLGVDSLNTKAGWSVICSGDIIVR